MHGLRRALGPERIETHGKGYRLRLDPGELDLDDFERLVARAAADLASGRAADAAEDLRRALTRWRGVPLADLAGEGVFETEGAQLEERRLRAVELLHEAELALGRHDDLVPELERLIAAEPYRERLRVQHALALYRSGRQADALAACRAARELLVEELGVDPGPELQELERGILRHDPALAAPAAPGPAHVRLPTAPTPLVGRRLEVAAVCAHLRRDDVRLVTLTGPGGAGKTRLALAATAEVGPELRDGAVFVDLSSLHDPALLGSSIADALEVSETTEPVEEVLATHLGDRSMLLVLDNLEQLVPDVALVARLLAAAPRLLVLATSRTPLRLAGEHEYPVPPLALPAPGPDTRFEELVSNDAVRLFTARAAAVDPDFRLDEHNIGAVADVCLRLDGLPLAIELAAARSKLLPPETMSSRLDRALDLLVGGAHDLPGRQQTLRATLEWSHGLLGEEERALFSRLAVFAGSWTLEAAEAVCDGDDLDVFETLSSLVDESLVVPLRQPGGEPRFTMLETIRAYSRECLRASGAADRPARRHADFYLDLAEGIDRAVRAGGVDPVPLLDRVEAEHDNFRAALDRLHDEGDVARELRLASALQYFWVVRGHHREGRTRLDRALSRERPDDPLLLARALASAGRIAYRQGDFEQARQRYTESLAAARAAGDEAAIGQALSDLGGTAIAAGDHGRAERLYAESAAALRRAGYVVRLGTVLNNTAVLCLELGETGRARELADEALALQDESGDKEGRIFTVLTLGRIALGEGRDAEARRMLHESLTLAREVGYRDVSAPCLLGLAEVALRRGDAALAARLSGAADAILESVGIARLGADDHAARESLVRRVEEALGAERAEELRVEGAALSLDDLLADVTSRT